MTETGARPRPSENDGVVSAFLWWAQRSPGRVAVWTDADDLTYTDLETESRRIAAGLVAKGLQRGGRVMIALNRGVDSIAAMLGVVRAGGVYVPVDPAWPESRLDEVSRIIDPVLAIVAGADAGRSVFRNASTVRTIGDAGEAGASGFADVEAAGDDPLYVMFTSGTTGAPKGVVVPHRAVRRLVLEADYLDGIPARLEGIGAGADLKGGEQRVWLHLAATSFDAATLELWAPLTAGHAIAVVADPMPSLDRIASVIASRNVTDAWLTSSLFNAMVDDRIDAFAPMRQVLTGGERLSPPHVARFLERWPGVRLINGYGPTENTTFTCCHTITAADVEQGDASALGVPIGRPIAGTRVRIVDGSLADVPQGETGELLAGGEGVALGYLNDPELTAARFVTLADEPGTVWYRTGDLVRRATPDAPIEFVGRRDRQVKIRGHRIELEEVERVLRGHPGVASAFAMAVGDRADTRRLAAAFEPNGSASAGEPADAESLRAWVAERLPGPFVPDALVRLEAVPIGPNGKADGKAIEAIVHARLGGADVTGPLRTSVAHDAASRPVWDEVAGILRDVVPGANPTAEDGFIGIGGHSLAALRFAAFTKTRFGIEIPVADILRCARLGDLAARIEQGDGGRFADTAVERSAAGKHGPTRASSIQRQFYFENAVDPTGVAYLEHAAFLTRDPRFDPARMERAFVALVARHEALRTVLAMDGDDLVQRVGDAGEANRVRITTHEPIGGDADAVRTTVRDAVARPFDLDRDWPARLDLFPLERSGWIVVLTFQHAAIDEWTLRILAEELAAAYAAPEGVTETSPTPAVPYRVYSRSEGEGEAPDLLERTVDAVLAADRPSMKMGRAPAVAVTRDVRWDAERIEDAAARLGVTPTACFAGLYASALARVFGLSRLAMLTPVSRRLDARTQRVVGCCNMMVPLVIRAEDPDSARGVRRIIEAAAEGFAGLYAHEPVPYELVARAMHGRGAGGGAAVPFGFAYETNRPFCPVFDGLEADPFPIRGHIARFPIGLAIDAREGARVTQFTAPRSKAAESVLEQLAEAIAEAGALVLSDEAEGDPRSGMDQSDRVGADAVGSPAGAITRSGISPNETEVVEIDQRAESARVASEAWATVLGAPPSGNRAHFFDSGGHSLLLLRLAARVRTETGHEIPLGAFLDEPTFGRLVALIEQRAAGDAVGDAGFQIEEFGKGDRTIVCIPGAFGRPLSFARLAESFEAQGVGVRLRCYNVFDAMSGRPVPSGFDRVLAQLSRDFENPRVVGLLGFCAGGLYPLFLEALAESRMRNLRLWLLNVFAPEESDGWFSSRARSVRDALLNPVSLPGAFRDSAVTMWRMGMARMRGSDEGVSADHFTHVEFQKVLARRQLGAWRGGSTVVIAGRKPIWRTHYRNSRLNGLAANLQGPTRMVVLPIMHHELLGEGAAAVAREIANDLASLDAPAESSAGVHRGMRPGS